MNTTKRNESGWILSREYGDPEATCRYHSGYYADYEIEEVKKQHEEYWAKIQKESYEEWARSEPGKMCVEMYAKFQEYKKFLEEHPWARDPRGYLEKYAEHELFAAVLGEVSNHQAERAERDRKNLEKAQLAARCEHVFMDGERCGAPRMRGKKLCRMHDRLEAANTEKLDLGPMEDPESIPLAIKRLLAAILEGTVDSKLVGQLTNLINVAAWNVRGMRSRS
ncbi:MAG TPA: hypothetical protein VFP59_10285 [Candidatus Angelobacter sp.]|nr:hypothetical protein [Candidatus Angelobacter sp.]